MYSFFFSQELMKGCEHLRTLSLLGSFNIGDESFKAIASKHWLKTIKVDSNIKISDISLKAIGKNCPELHQLYMTDCQRLTDLSLKNLAQCRFLTVVNLADCIRCAPAARVTSC